VDDRLRRLESTVEQLRSAVLALQQRIDALDARGPLPMPGASADAVVSVSGDSPVAARAPAIPAARGWRDPLFVISLIGRLALVLAGAYLLRGMTDTGVLDQSVGVSLGFAYGLVWLFLTDRAGERRQLPSAVFHAIAAAMVAFPLLLEATTRFKVLPGATAALAIAVLTAGLLAVAWRQRLHAVAWVTVVVAVPTSIVMLASTHVVVPFAFYLIAFGVATLWMGYALDWRAIRWPVALAADMVVFGVTMRALAPEHQDEPNVAMLVQFSLLGAYLVSIAIRTLVRGRNVVPFEVVQTTAALLVGFGGAVYVTKATGTLPTALGIASLVFGAACYGIAVAFIDRREDHGWNVYFYTTLALVLVLAGFALVLDPRWLGVVFAALAMLTAALWYRVGRLFMLIHGAAYIAAAGIVSDTLAYCTWALAAGTVGLWTVPGAAMIVIVVAAAVSALLAAGQPASDTRALAGVPRFVIILTFVWAAGGCLIGYLAPVAGGLPDHAVDLGVLATVRTGVLALATLLLAWIGRHDRYREWGWLVYPLLVGIGLKMVAQDFMHSRPTTLFIALALYGTALIVAPRLRSGGGEDIAQPSA
jgi:hypothetical protein